MGLDWSTFLLEILNFLILIWILKHFFYAPVKAALERRRERVAAELAEAQARRAEAQALQADYESRQANWERERAEARAALDQELDQLRQHRLEALRQELERESEKAGILAERAREQSARHAEEAALRLATDFMARLLERLADRHLEGRLLDLLIADLPSMTQSYAPLLDPAVRNGLTQIRIHSAHILTESQRHALRVTLERLLGRELSLDFAQDGDLIAGVRIDAGPLVIRANLRDELQAFAEAAR
jgi:F-type H+-transporting ATPase subunit b